MTRAGWSRSLRADAGRPRPEDTASGMGQAVHAAGPRGRHRHRRHRACGPRLSRPARHRSGHDRAVGTCPAGRAFRSAIGERPCGRPVTFANDANAAAYWRVSSRLRPAGGSLATLMLGTGVGGIIIGDLNIEGATAMAPSAATWSSIRPTPAALPLRPAQATSRPTRPATAAGRRRPASRSPPTPVAASPRPSPAAADLVRRSSSARTPGGRPAGDGCRHGSRSLAGHRRGHAHEHDRPGKPWSSAGR